MGATAIPRRRVSRLTAAAALPLVHIRTAGAAGKLTVGLTDHWVAEGNDAMRQIVESWAEQNKVAVQLDFITSTGGKNLVTLATESQSRTGHDVRAFPTWMAIRLSALRGVLNRSCAGRTHGGDD